jgi:hypothetical protein
MDEFAILLLEGRVQLLAAFRDGLEEIAIGLGIVESLERRAINRLGHPGSAGIDHQQIALLEQRAEHAAPERHAGQAGIARPPFIGDQRAARTATGGSPGEADVDCAAGGIVAVERHAQGAAPGLGVVLAGGQPLRPHPELLPSLAVAHDRRQGDQHGQQQHQQQRRSH